MKVKYLDGIAVTEAQLSLEINMFTALGWKFFKKKWLPEGRSHHIYSKDEEEIREPLRFRIN